MPRGRFHIGLCRTVAGGAFGAGLASIASLALAATGAPTPAFGPSSIILFGYDVPVLSAIFGLLGVVLARRVAPITAAEAKLGRNGQWALTLLLAIGVLALIVSGEKRAWAALGWSIGLGYSGLAAVHLVASTAVAIAKATIDGFLKTTVALATAWSDRKGGGDAER